MNLQPATKAGMFRPTLHSTYAVPRNAQHKVTDGLRLGDLLEVTAKVGEPLFYESADAQKFAVIDVFKREKGFFEAPKGSEGHPDMITALIEAHFDSPAMRIDARLWMV